MPEDINAMIAMQRGQNPQGAFDPNAALQQKIAQIQALAQGGQITPQQAQMFIAQIMQQAQTAQQQAGQQAPPEQAQPQQVQQQQPAQAPGFGANFLAAMRNAGRPPTLPPNPAAQRAQDNADLAAALRQPMIPPRGQ